MIRAKAEQIQYNSELSWCNGYLIDDLLRKTSY